MSQEHLFGVVDDVLTRFSRPITALTFSSSPWLRPRTVKSTNWYVRARSRKYRSAFLVSWHFLVPKT
jgi:hypothetical protein